MESEGGERNLMLKGNAGFSFDPLDRFFVGVVRQVPSFDYGGAVSYVFGGGPELVGGLVPGLEGSGVVGEDVEIDISFGELGGREIIELGVEHECLIYICLCKYIIMFNPPTLLVASPVLLVAKVNKEAG